MGYKKIAKTPKLSCSTVAKTIQQFNRKGSTQNRPRHSRPKKLSARAHRHIQRLCLGNKMYECFQHCCRGWRGGGSACQCSDHTPHTASNWSVWLSSQKEASSKDDAYESPQTVCWGLHECCQHWRATVHWGNHECQHVLWHSEAEHDPLPLETGLQGSIPTR